MDLVSYLDATARLLDILSYGTLAAVVILGSLLLALLLHCIADAITE